MARSLACRLLPARAMRGQLGPRRRRTGAALPCEVAAGPTRPRTAAAAVDLAAADLHVGSKDFELGLTAAEAAARTAVVTARGSEVHASHRLAAHRGLRWCSRCGAYAFGRRRGLRAECEGEPIALGRAVLRRLARDPPLPPPHTAWR